VVFDTADALTPQPSNLYGDVYLYDSATDSLDNVTTEGDYYSFGASISDDGALIAFSSVASNLVPGDTELSTDVFIHDVAADSFIWVTEGANAASTNAVISGDGSTLMFRSGASNLVPGDDFQDDVFLYDVATGGMANITLGRSAFDFGMALSGDGSTVVLQSTTNLGPDPFHILLYDVAGATFTDITAGANGTSNAGPQAISGDGSRVVFSSIASNLTSGDSNGVEDVFLYDTATGDLVNITAGANGASRWSGLSADGSTIVFASGADNLTAGDTNGVDDIFLYDIESGTFTNITAGANGSSYTPMVSADGHALSFASDADNLSANDVNGTTDVFLYTLI
jgi:Tol biopolymer transport system component